MKGEALSVEVARLLEPGPDAPAIEAIAREAFEGPSFSPLEELTRAWARVWVARADTGEPVGFLVAWHVADELHVLNVAALSASRRRGIGSALVREAVAYAVASRVRLVLLEVRRSNTPAIRLYKKFAFHTSGLRERYYGDGEDAVEMALALDPESGQVLAREDEIALDT